MLKKVCLVFIISVLGLSAVAVSYFGNSNNSNQVVRTVNLEGTRIDSIAVMNGFTDSEFDFEDNIGTLTVTQVLDEMSLSKIDNISTSELENALDSTLEIIAQYDVENGIMILFITHTSICKEILEFETIYGYSFINELGELDVKFNFDGEIVLLSELNYIPAIDDVFLRRITNAVTTAANVVVNTVRNVISTITTVAQATSLILSGQATGEENNLFEIVFSAIQGRVISVITIAQAAMTTNPVVTAALIASATSNRNHNRNQSISSNALFQGVNSAPGEMNANIINNQNQMRNFRFGAAGAMGWRHVGDNGCGPIAIYNALRMSGNPQNLCEIIFRTEMANGALAAGFFGTNPAIIGNVLSSFSRSSVTFTNLTLAQTRANMYGNAIIILTKWNENPLSQGAHFVTIRKTGNQYQQFNGFRNGNSLQDLISGQNGTFIAATVIRA